MHPSLVHNGRVRGVQFTGGVGVVRLCLSTACCRQHSLS